jgi:hypothetical protein
MNRIAQTHDPSLLERMERALILRDDEIKKKDKIISAQAKQLHYFETKFTKTWGQNVCPAHRNLLHPSELLALQMRQNFEKEQEIYEKEMEYYNNISEAPRDFLCHVIEELVRWEAKYRVEMGSLRESLTLLLSEKKNLQEKLTEQNLFLTHNIGENHGDR